MKRILSVFLAIVMLFSAMAITVSAADFRDTNAHWAAEFIDYWTAEKAISGYPDATFRPENSVTRGEVAQVIAKILNLTPTSKSSPFKDMTDAAWYYTAVLACYDNGIIHGYPDKTVRAEAPISREQAILMISRITNVSANATAAGHFVDNKQVSSWAVGAIGALYSAGVLDGYKTAAGMEVRPQNNVSRAEFLKLLATVDKADNIKYTVGDRKAADNEPDEPIIIPAIAASTTTPRTYYKASVEIYNEGNVAQKLDAQYITTNDSGTTPILSDIYRFVDAKRADLKAIFTDTAAVAEMDAIIATFVANNNMLTADDLSSYAITYEGDAMNRGFGYFLGSTYKTLGVGTYTFKHTVTGSGNTYVAKLTIEKA